MSATKSRIMYIEAKGGDILAGMARIGRVTFSKSGKSLYYRDREFRPGSGVKVNYFETTSGDPYWISGCKRKGGDRLYSGVIEIDADVREEYWTEIRKMPEKKAVKSFHSAGKYSK